MVVITIDIAGDLGGVVGGPGGGFGGPGGGFRAPGGGFGDNRCSGKPLLLLRFQKRPPGAPKPPPGPSRQKTNQKQNKQ